MTTPRNLRISLLLLVSFGLVLCLLPGDSSAQKAGRLEIGQWRDVLKNLKAALKDNYYDPSLRGIEKLKNRKTLILDFSSRLQTTDCPYRV